MRILLFGAGGLLGRHLVHELRGHDLSAFAHGDADITDASRLDELFRSPWDAVINAAAVCDFDACEKDPEGTARINLDAPLDLARRCAVSGSTFVQFTSDYIFPGDLDRPLAEDDAPAPLSAYGVQKAALEREIPRLCAGALMLRLSWLYGHGGRTFMSLLPGLLAERESLRVASGKRGSCLYARDAAQWVHRLLAARAVGLFNLVNEGCTSWEEFARAALELMRASGANPRCRAIEEVPYEGMGANWSKRPRRSCLDIGTLRRTMPPGPRRWQDALADFLREEKSFAAPPPAVNT